MDTPDDVRSNQAQATPPRRIAAAAGALAAIGAILTLALWALAQVTQARIERNRQAWIEGPLEALLSSIDYDNDVLADRFSVVSRDLLGTNVPGRIYRARMNGQPAAAVIQTVAPDGYRGPIHLLVAIAPDGELIGVDVIRHDETPGIGNVFETRQRHWIEAFAGLSLSDPPQQRWTVERDGGDFDALTGATITSRAIVRGVRRALEFYRAQQRIVYERPADAVS